MTLYTLSGGSEPVLKMEIVFKSGASYEAKPAVAEVMAALLTEGTKRLSSAELAEEMEFLGATIQTRGGVDTVRVRLYTLTRYFPKMLSLVKEIIDQPAFAEEELRVFIRNKVERLQIDLTKNEILAYRHLTESIFGTGHPYGKNHLPSDYENITREDLEDHYQKYFHPSDAMVFLSGSFGPSEIETLHQVLGTWKKSEPRHPLPGIPPTESRSGILVIDGPQKHQAAIRIGRRLFPETHPDYNGLYVLNTLLGGYFGSRLMNEIRENQGLTYGIYSSIDTFVQDGCFYISTETAVDQVEKMLAAIHQEVTRLKTELISNEELTMARNYLMGHLMTQLDGSIPSLDFIKTYKIEGVPDSQFFDLIQTIQKITPEELLTLANRYLNLEEWVTVIVK